MTNECHLRSREKHQKSDVFTFGLILWSMISAETPFRNVVSIESHYRAVYMTQKRPLFSPSFPLCLKNLIQRCWDIEINLRPSFHEIVALLQDASIQLFDDPFASELWRSLFLDPVCFFSLFSF